MIPNDYNGLQLLILLATVTFSTAKFKVWLKQGTFIQSFSCIAQTILAQLSVVAATTLSVESSH